MDVNLCNDGKVVSINQLCQIDHGAFNDLIHQGFSTEDIVDSGVVPHAVCV